MQSPSSQYQAVTNASAVEVVGMLGDSIVSVDHLEPASRAPSKSSARWLFCAGALMLVVSAFAFAKGVANAAANQAAFEAFRDSGMPAYQFRPSTLPLGYDYLAFGGLAFGVLAIAFGLLRLRATRAKSSFIVGTEADVDFATSDAPAARFPLVAERDGQMFVNVTDTMSARLAKDGAVFPLDNPSDSSFTVASMTVPGAYELALPETGSVRLNAGRASFVVRSVPANRARIDGFLGGFDRGAIKFFGGSAIAHLAVVALLATIPPSPRSLALDLGSNDGRITRGHTTPKENPIDTSKATGDNSGGSASTGAASAAAGPSGKAGRPDSTSTSGRRSIKDRSVDKHLARRIAIDEARDSGIAGALRRTNAAFKDVASAKDFASGYDEYDEVGGYDGQSGSEYGTWGSDRAGDGPGAGGTGGIYHTGNYNTIPGGNWPGPGGPGGTGGPTMRKHKPTGPKPTLGPPMVDGGLDKSIVRRYVRRQLDRIRHCYDRELLSSPHLRGSVKVSFVISGTGAVISATGAGMHGSMNGCVASVVRGIQFPKSDGGLVTVSYPFHFSNTAN